MGAWAWWVASRVGGDPTPVILVGMLAVCSYAAAHWVARIRRLLVPRLVVFVTVAIMFLPGIDRVLGARATGRLYAPLGYANASALLFLLATVCAVIVARETTSEPAWRAWSFTAALLALLVVGSGSVVAVALMLGMIAVGLWCGQTQAARGTVMVVGAAAAVVVAVGVTVWLGASQPRAAPTTAVESAGDWDVAATVLTERRLLLWRDAVVMLAEQPTVGAGPQRFPVASPTVQSDADAFTTHSTYLLVASELGLVGLALLGALVLWSYVALWQAVLSGATLLAVAAVTATLMHATVDYVLHAPAIVIVTAALLAWARGSVSSGSRPTG